MGAVSYDVLKQTAWKNVIWTVDTVLKAKQFPAEPGCVWHCGEFIVIDESVPSVRIRDRQKIISGDLEKVTKGNDIFYAWLVFPTLDIGDLSLRHMDGFSKLCLVQVCVLPQIPDPLTKGWLHSTHLNAILA